LPQHDHSRSQEHWRNWNRVFRRGLIAAVLLHIVIVLLFRQAHVIPEIESSAAGEAADDARAAAGGGMEMITLRVEEAAPEPEAVVEVPVPVPVPVPPPPVQEEPSRAPSRTAGQSPATSGEGRGQEAGPGTETGTGRGDAGSGEEGTGRIIAPSPRGLILPPSDRPGSVRGKTVTVYVFVDTRGMVVRDSTRLNPSTGDARFDSRLRQQASEWRFTPARQDGQPIAAWFPYTITF
jgi:outer membrane biosynthesis protein TonB